MDSGNTCPLCGKPEIMGQWCDCEGAWILSKLGNVDGAGRHLEHAHLYAKEYEALRAKIINLYTKEEFNFDSKVGKMKLIHNDYDDNFKGD